MGCGASKMPLHGGKRGGLITAGKRVQHRIGGNFAQPSELAFGELARGGLPLFNKLGEAGCAIQMLPRLAVAHAAHGWHIGVQRGVALPQLAHFV